MKQIVTFSILSCLVFLNVPRSFVHDCEHQVHSLNVENHQQRNDDGMEVFNIDQNHCFICEFDLDSYQCPEIKIASFSFFYNYSFNEIILDYSEPNKFHAFSHRGPPAV